GRERAFKSIGKTGHHRKTAAASESKRGSGENCPNPCASGQRAGRGAEGTGKSQTARRCPGNSSCRFVLMLPFFYHTLLKEGDYGCIAHAPHFHLWAEIPTE